MQAGGIVAVGVAYTDANGFQGIASQNLGVNYDIPAFQPGGSIDMDVELLPTIGINLLDGIFQIDMDAPVTLALQTSGNLCPAFTLDYNVTATATVGLSILSTSWTETIYPNTELWSYAPQC